MYKVTKLDAPVEINGIWDKSPWNKISTVAIDNYMGEEPGHKPRAEAKLAYDDHAIYVIFRVEDKFVRAVSTHYQDKPYEDSCVEFFFTPGNDIADGYFNLEMNCGGNALFHFQKIPRKNSTGIPEGDFKKMTVAHTLPEIVDPEIAGPVTWLVEYRLPFEILEGYGTFIRPAPGVTWQANLYKCADKSSQPHWLTWAPVDRPKPDFHRPEFFGKLQFE